MVTKEESEAIKNGEVKISDGPNWVVQIQEKLSAPFPVEDLQWRVSEVYPPRGSNGPQARVLCYVTARAVMNRLDEVVGAVNWKDKYTHMENGVLCELSIREQALGLNRGYASEGCWVTKEDGSPETKIESFKGGISKALVRCAVKWGIGRYLYELGDTKVSLHSSEWIKNNDKGASYNWLNDKKHGMGWLAWKDPELPLEFLP